MIVVEYEKLRKWAIDRFGRVTSQIARSHLDRDHEANVKRSATLLDERANIVTELDLFPTFDAVEVVRCRDCKHFHTDVFQEVNGIPLIVAHEICDFWGEGCKTEPEAFCSAGERRKNDD